MSEDSYIPPTPRSVIAHALALAPAVGVTDLGGFARFITANPIRTYFAEPCTMTFYLPDGPEAVEPGVAWMAFDGGEWWGGCCAGPHWLKVWNQPENPTFSSVFSRMRAEGAPACMARLCHHLAKRNGVYIDFDRAPEIGPLTELFRGLGIDTPEDEAAACSQWRAEIAQNYDRVAALPQSRYMTLADIAQMIDHHQRRLPEVPPQ